MKLSFKTHYYKYIPIINGIYISKYTISKMILLNSDWIFNENKFFLFQITRN